MDIFITISGPSISFSLCVVFFFTLLVFILNYAQASSFVRNHHLAIHILAAMTLAANSLMTLLLGTI